jgi:hypothetical protein
MGDTSIELWFNKYQHDAQERILSQPASPVLSPVCPCVAFSRQGWHSNTFEKVRPRVGALCDGLREAIILASGGEPWA